MRIDRLVVENFRRFRRVDLELPDGVIAIVGRNGAGKSTLLEAIGWCLFGNEAARTQKDLLKRRGAAPGDDVRVQLSFRFGAHAYVVTRELLGKAGTPVATVSVDGRVVVPAGAMSGKEATAYVERLFHMERAAFFTSIVARQTELQALSQASRSERKRILVGLLRLDAIDAAIARARQEKREARAELQGLRAAMLDRVALATQIDAARATVAMKRQELAAREAAIAALVDEVEDARARRETGRKLAQEHRTVLAQVALLEERLTRSRAERARLAQVVERARAAAAQAELLEPRVVLLAPARERVERLSARAIQHQEATRLAAEIQRADDDARKAADEAARSRAALAGAATLRALAQRAAEARPRLEAAVEEAQRAFAAAEAGARELARQINELAAKERRVREMGPESPCPTCTRPLREHYGSLLHEFGGDLSKFRAEMDRARAALDDAKVAEAARRAELVQHAARETELREKLQTVLVEEQRLTAASGRLADAQARAARFREAARPLDATPFDPAELKHARDALGELEIARDQQARMRVEAEREREALPALDAEAVASAAAESALAQARAAVAALAFDAAAHDALERATEASEAKLTEARLSRERLAGECARAEDARAQVEATLAQQEALAARAAGIESRALVLEQLAGERDAGLLPEFKDHLIARFRPLLSLHAGRLFRELTEGRYADLELDESYDLVVHDEGEAFALSRFSGGETDLANLCLRLAVGQVVAERAGGAGIGLLALDEIFGSQDEIRKGNILRTLSSLSGRFRQILLITHIADVKEGAEYVLSVEPQEDGTSALVML